MAKSTELDIIETGTVLEQLRDVQRRHNTALQRRNSRERAMLNTKLDEAIHWGMADIQVMKQEQGVE